jgi:branched-chain amino acid transport system permease protein
MAVVCFLPGGIMEGINRLLGFKHTPRVKSLGDSPQRDGLGESVIEEMPSSHGAAEADKKVAENKAAENKAAEKKRAVAP